MNSLLYAAFVLCVITISSCAPVGQENVYVGYEHCDLGQPDKLNVHLVCHTHDDVGWLKTVDQYFYGANNSIQNAGVQYILDSVVQSLSHDANKKFTYVETAFFWRWWNTQTDFVKHQVQNLVRNGQLEFAGGGWSMNDEAATHYNSIIDQMTWGLRRLNDTFGAFGLPKVAWQIDPFGHSREQASIFAQMYFDGLFFGRLDYQDKDKRMVTKTMEHIWAGSQNLGLSSELFTGALRNGYSPPPGFCFDLLCSDEPIMDDSRLKDYNVDRRVSEFIEYAVNQSAFYATNNILITMGNDFNYQTAATWYKNLDKLIKYVNERQSNGSHVNVLYSTPGCYLYALNQANHTWTKKLDDFLPYASDPHAYWTGYFTSRPSIKHYERIGNNNLQVCKQLASVAEIQDLSVTTLREAMGIMQHHDAVTGTEKQHVSNDYAQTLASAIKECQGVVQEAYEKILSVNGSVVENQVFCNYLNISQCDISESGKPVAVIVYNPLSWEVSTYVRLPVSGKAYKVFDPDGKVVDAQTASIPDAVEKIPGRKSNATSEVVFPVRLPPLGSATYLVRPSASKVLSAMQKSKEKVKLDGDWTIGNEFYTVFVSNKTGLLRGIRLADGTNITINQSFYYYKGMNGNNTEFKFRASGAYIFRPNGTDPVSLGTNVTVTLVNGTLFQEIRQVFTPWLSQIIRVYKGVENIEFNWIVGPIPVEDKIGKEIITRFDTDFQTEKKFYTDSNGREILTRLRNYRPTWELNVTEPISGNYYPVNSRIYIRDRSRNLQLTVLNDRSQGGSSVNDGSVELMIHRRLLHDDAFGVGEALNETGVDGKGLVIRGSHFLIVSDIPSSASKHRPLAHKLYLQPQLSFSHYNESEVDFVKTHKAKFSSLKSSVPENIHMLTLEPWKSGNLLIRLEHIYEFYEDIKLSKNTTVSLKDLFTLFEITSLSETTLSANQFLEKAKRLIWNPEDSYLPHFETQSTGVRRWDQNFTVSLFPMQIRTFVAQYKAH